MSELAPAIDRDYVDTGNLVRIGVLKGSFVFAYRWILDPTEAIPGSRHRARTDRLRDPLGYTRKTDLRGSRHWHCYPFRALIGPAYQPHISAVISGGRCITFWRELSSRMEVSGEEIVGVGED